MYQPSSPKLISFTFGILVLTFLVSFYVIAWTEPGQSPPQGNVAAPLNTGNVGQSKEGGLILNTGGAEKGLIIDKGKVCIGTDCIDKWPSAGNVKVVIGSSCPGGYSPAMYYYESKTCKSQKCTDTGGWFPPTCVDYSSCTTPATWSPALGAVYFITYYTTAPTTQGISIIPSCPYRTGTDGPIVCSADVISRTICAINNP
ncbi:MAG: hypothetical protein ABH952_05515 [Candidatus Omnitrophota bacterium]